MDIIENMPRGLLITGIVLLTTIVLAILISLVLWITTDGLKKTPKNHLKKIFDILNLQSDQIFADFGSGIGNIVFFAAKTSAKKIYGYEISPVLALFSRIRIAFRFKGRRKTNLQVENILSLKPEDYDVIYCYLNERMLELLEDKFQKELNTNVTIFSYLNKFPTVTPAKVHELDVTTNLYEYNADSFQKVSQESSSVSSESSSSTESTIYSGL